MGNCCPGGGHIRLPESDVDGNSDLPTTSTNDALVINQQPVAHSPTVQPGGVAHVFWDIENCQIPKGISPTEVISRIRQLRTPRGYAPSRIVAAIAQGHLSTAYRDDLMRLGVDLLDCSSTKASASDLLILDEIQRFTLSHSPETSGVILITSDRDFGRRLSILREAGYDVLLVHQGNAPDILLSVVGRRLLWPVVCGVQPATPSTSSSNSLSLLPRPMETTGEADPSQILLSSAHPISKSGATSCTPGEGLISREARTEPALSAKPGRPNRFPDFAVAYNLLWCIELMNFHLVAGHKYPDLVFTTLLELEEEGFVYLRTRPTSNPVPAFVFAFLTHKGAALRKLLKEVDKSTDKFTGRRPFRQAVYLWIRDAIVHGTEEICRISVLGEKIKPLLENRTITNYSGKPYDSVTAYFTHSVSNGVFSTTPYNDEADSCLILQQPLAERWLEFKRSVQLHSSHSAEGLQGVACGTVTAQAVMDELAGCTRDELLFLPLAMLQAEPHVAASKEQVMYWAKLLGWTRSQALRSAQKADILLLGAGGQPSQLTAKGVNLVKSFKRALERNC